MEYILISKIESVNGEYKNTPIGYVTSQTEADKVDEKFKNFVNDNMASFTSGSMSIKTEIDGFLDTNPLTYSVLYKTDNIDGLGLDEILDVTSL